MRFPRFNRHDRFWIWYVLIIISIYVIGVLIWRTVAPQTAESAIGLLTMVI